MAATIPHSIKIELMDEFFTTVSRMRLKGSYVTGGSSGAPEIIGTPQPFQMEYIVDAIPSDVGRVAQLDGEVTFQIPFPFGADEVIVDKVEFTNTAGDTIYIVEDIPNITYTGLGELTIDSFLVYLQ